MTDMTTRPKQPSWLRGWVVKLYNTSTPIEAFVQILMLDGQSIGVDGGIEHDEEQMHS